MFKAEKLFMVKALANVHIQSVESNSYTHITVDVQGFRSIHVTGLTECERERYVCV